MLNLSVMKLYGYYTLRVSATFHRSWKPLWVRYPCIGQNQFSLRINQEKMRFVYTYIPVTCEAKELNSQIQDLLHTMISSRLLLKQQLSSVQLDSFSLIKWARRCTLVFYNDTYTTCNISQMEWPKQWVILRNKLWHPVNILRRGKIAAIVQTTFWNAFPWMKMYEFRLKFHWTLFQRFQLTISQHWFR